MAKQMICDCCSAPLTPGNWTIADDEVCDNCWAMAEAMGEWTRRDVLRGQPLGTTAREVFKLYEVAPEEGYSDFTVDREARMR